MPNPIVVVGAGPAGLATAARLRARGAEVILLDREAAVGSNWRRRYDGLRLNTVRWLSHLPGRRIPGRMGRWVGRDDFVEYLETYAAHHRLTLEPNVEVLRIDPGKRWRLYTTRGELDAGAVVVATGAFDVPVMPSWPGLAQYRGDICHACEYRNPGPYVGRRVLVVGAGASGLEIAALLADGGAAEVRLAARSCQNLFTRQWHGIPLTPTPSAQHLPTRAMDIMGAATHLLLGRDWPSPLPRPAAGLGTALRRDGQEPVVADGVVEALREGRILLHSAVLDLGEHDVLLADGSTLRPDAIIVATGYTNGLGKLVGHLGVLSDKGLPAAGGGQAIAALPGMVFVGFEPTVTGRLLQMASQARKAVHTISSLSN